MIKKLGETMLLATNEIFKKEKINKERSNYLWSDLILNYIENKLETIHLFVCFLVMPTLITFLMTALYINKVTVFLTLLSPFAGLFLCYLGLFGFGKYNFFNNKKNQYEKIISAEKEIKNKLSTVLIKKENQAEIVDTMNFFINQNLLSKNSSQENMKRNKINFLLKLEEKDYEGAVKYLLDFFVCFSRNTISSTLYEKSLLNLKIIKEVKVDTKKEKYLKML